MKFTGLFYMTLLDALLLLLSLHADASPVPPNPGADQGALTISQGLVQSWCSSGPVAGTGGSFAIAPLTNTALDNILRKLQEVGNSTDSYRRYIIGEVNADENVLASFEDLILNELNLNILETTASPTDSEGASQNQDLSEDPARQTAVREHLITHTESLAMALHFMKFLESEASSAVSDIFFRDADDLFCRLEEIHCVVPKDNIEVDDSTTTTLNEIKSQETICGITRITLASFVKNAVAIIRQFVSSELRTTTQN